MILLICLIYVSGDVEQVVKEVGEFLETSDEFLDRFITESFKVSSSMQLTMAWLRVGRFVAMNPTWVADNMAPEAAPYHRRPRNNDDIEIVRTFFNINRLTPCINFCIKNYYMGLFVLFSDNNVLNRSIENNSNSSPIR